jgi:polyphosphate kinase
VVEPRARFDEGRNIAYAEAFQEAGVRVILGVPNLKVHAKLCLVARTEGGRPRYYSAIGTGNFNEDTAKLYTDHLLFTASHDLGADLALAFQFFEHPYRVPHFKRLCAAPHGLRDALARWVNTEIENARAGREAGILIKLNNLSDVPTVSLLYRASAAGVPVRIIARSMFSLIPGRPGVSENIQAISIIDRFLEHSRVFVFANGGERRVFLSSADFLPRNFDARFEVVCPVDSPDLQQELVDYLEIQWADNVKARVLDKSLKNAYRKRKKKAKPVRAQIAIGDYLTSLSR